MGYWVAHSIHPAMYGHSSVFSILLPGPSHLFFLNYESQNREHFFFSRNSWIFSHSAVALLFTLNERAMRLNFECLLPSFLQSLQAVYLPACVGMSAQGSWLGLLLRLHRSRCAVLWTASHPETTDYEIPVGQIEWRKQKRSQEGYSESALSLISIKQHYYIWKAPQILWFSSPTDRLLQAECEVQSSGSQML